MNFLTKEEVLVLHDAVLEMHGGEAGFLNESMLESALGAAVNRHGYEGATLAQCAATYAYHVTKAHAFVDGNKRIGVAATIAFLRLNDATLVSSQDEWHDVILDIAAGRMTRDDVDAWMTARVRTPSP